MKLQIILRFEGYKQTLNYVVHSYIAYKIIANKYSVHYCSSLLLMFLLNVGCYAHFKPTKKKLAIVETL